MAQIRAPLNQAAHPRFGAWRVRPGEQATACSATRRASLGALRFRPVSSPRSWTLSAPSRRPRDAFDRPRHALARTHQLQPHRIRVLKRSNAPEFTEKVDDIVGLYMEEMMAARDISGLQQQAWLRAVKRLDAFKATGDEARKVVVGPFRTGGRDQVGTVADIKSEVQAGSPRNSQLRPSPHRIGGEAAGPDRQPSGWRRPFVPQTTMSRHEFEIAPTWRPASKRTGLDQIWLADIT